MDNLVQEPMPAALPAAIPGALDGLSQHKKDWKPFRPASSLCYSAIFSVLSPISAIGFLELLTHFFVQR